MDWCQCFSLFKVSNEPVERHNARGRTSRASRHTLIFNISVSWFLFEIRSLWMVSNGESIRLRVFDAAIDHAIRWIRFIWLISIFACDASFWENIMLNRWAIFRMVVSLMLFGIACIDVCINKACSCNESFKFGFLFCNALTTKWKIP